jgi:hypothetical protein
MAILNNQNIYRMSESALGNGKVWTPWKAQDLVILVILTEVCSW